MNLFKKAVLSALAIFVLGSASASYAALQRFEGSPHFMPAPLMVVGTYTEDGHTNFGTFHRGGILTSKDKKAENPYLRIGFTVRKKSDSSFTLANIQREGGCTINLPSVKYLPHADLFGSYSGINSEGEYQDKLAASGLTAVPAEKVHAPMIEEFPVSLECELEEIIQLHPDSTGRMVVLKVVKALADESYLDDKGNVNPDNGEKNSSLAYFCHGKSKDGGYLTFGEFLGKPGVPSAELRK